MKTTIKALDNNNEMYSEVTTKKAIHLTMPWVRTYLRWIENRPEDKVRIDIKCSFGDTHMEITHSDKWMLTYVEDEVFCDTALEFDTKGELHNFIKDILKSLEQTDKAERAWA
jgi:hypothetical protein